MQPFPGLIYVSVSKWLFQSLPCNPSPIVIYNRVENSLCTYLIN